MNTFIGNKISSEEPLEGLQTSKAKPRINIKNTKKAVTLLDQFLLLLLLLSPTGIVKKGRTIALFFIIK